MTIVNRLSRGLEILLELVAALLMVALTAIVIYSVLWRYVGGASPRWYDEVASIMLVWLTYYAGALAALKRGHIGVDGLLLAMPLRYRMPTALLAEACVIGFFAVLAWMGMVLIDILGGMSLISLRWVPLAFTQSVIPIGAALFILAQLLSMPRHLAKVRAGISQEHEEIEDALARAEETLAREHASIDGRGEGQRP
jgi:TRAP-type C4-dicarboxylate transport system permease small subunit